MTNSRHRPSQAVSISFLPPRRSLFSFKPLRPAESWKPNQTPFLAWILNSRGTESENNEMVQQSEDSEVFGLFARAPRSQFCQLPSSRDKLMTRRKLQEYLSPDFFFPEVRDVIKGLSEILSHVLDVWDVGKLVEMCVFLMHARWKWRIFTALYIFVVCLTTSEAFKAEIVYSQFIYIY